MLSLSARAVEKVKFFAAQMPEAAGKALRIFVQGGGCSGLQYGFTFDDWQDGDTVVEAQDLKVLVDPLSAPYLEGARVDYVEDLRGAGFVVDNPNAIASCSCGQSFAAGGEDSTDPSTSGGGCCGGR
ncbi:MAG: iron-sulfur cluster insertion protein ErpA [Thermoanaerobaculaceae bacterium]|nr:iron-sulfur cluster insertion protein ErpA [Thermoanaerobaculaceae bacterium]